MERSGRPHSKLHWRPGISADIPTLVSVSRHLKVPFLTSIFINVIIGKLKCQTTGFWCKYLIYNFKNFTISYFAAMHASISVAKYSYTCSTFQINCLSYSLLVCFNFSKFSLGEWTSPAYKYVDPFAKSKCTSTVEQLMRTPKPPEGGYQPAPPVEIRGARPMSADSKEAARREFRWVDFPRLFVISTGGC